MNDSIDWRQRLLDAHPHDVARIADNMADEIDDLRSSVETLQTALAKLEHKPDQLSE